MEHSIELAPFMSLTECAAYLRVAPSTIKRLIEHQRLPHMRIGTRGDYRFRADLIEQWMREQSHAAN